MDTDIVNQMIDQESEIGDHIDSMIRLVGGIRRDLLKEEGDQSSVDMELGMAMVDRRLRMLRIYWLQYADKACEVNFAHYKKNSSGRE